MKFPQVAAGVVVLSVLMILLAIGGRYTKMKINEWFAPREQNIQREVFEATKSFNEAKEQELIKYRFEWQKAKGRGDSETMKAVESAVRAAFADYSDYRLSSELQEFVRKCKYGGV